MRTLRKFLALVLVAAAAGATPPLAQAQKWPAKPVHILVPFAPGGGSDFIARFTAQRLTDALGTQVLVENRPGAGGLLGIEQGVKAEPDGYTLTLIASSYTVNAALYPLKYDPIADITPVVQISQGPMIIVANPKFAAKGVPDLISIAKQKPGSINFASAGQGSITHMVAELFQSMAGVKMNHIPYKGTGPALTDTISGQTDIFFSSTATALPHVKSGRLRAIAVTTAKPFRLFPNIPSIAQSGYPGFEVLAWNGVMVPAATPKPIVARLNAEINAILADPDIVTRMHRLGFDLIGGTPEQFGALVNGESEKWAPVIRKIGLKID